jgi:quinohemoprotein ethanol dehydrogenase
VQKYRSPGGGDNLFLASIVALNADTGAYVWHYQETPGEQFDSTATQQMILADLPIGGHLRPVIMQAPKNGFFYVLDRRTGELLSADPLH